jgi:hypothetical protein
MSTERPPQRPVMAQKILQQSREAESALADALVSLGIEKFLSFLSLQFLNLKKLKLTLMRFKSLN